MTSTKWTAFLFINIYSTQCHVVQRSFDYFQLASRSFCNSYANAYESNTFRQLSNKFRYLHYIVHIDNLYNTHMYTFGICLYCVSVSQLYNSYYAFGIQGFLSLSQKSRSCIQTLVEFNNRINSSNIYTDYAMHSLKTHLKNTIEYLIYITFHLPRNELGITDAFVIKTTRDQQATQSQVHQSTHVSHTHTHREISVIFWQTDEHIWTRCIPLVKFLTFP